MNLGVSIDSKVMKIAGKNLDKNGFLIG